MAVAVAPLRLGPPRPTSCRQPSVVGAAAAWLLLHPPSASSQTSLVVGAVVAAGSRHPVAGAVGLRQSEVVVVGSESEVEPWQAPLEQSVAGAVELQRSGP